MQVPPEWVPSIFSFIGMIGSLILFLLTMIVAQRERSNIAEQVSLYRQTQLEHRRINALDKSQRLLEEAIRMIHPTLDYRDGFYPGGEFVKELILKGDVLNSLSYNCKHLGEDIRNVALILKSLVPVETVASDKYLSKEEQRKLLDNLATLKQTINDHLKELHQ